jgi:phosphoribosylamine--glycine ligase
MNILILGSGGREHAFAWKLRQSEICDKLYIAPGNAGTENVGENVALNPLEFSAIGNFCLEANIQMLVVGPEEPLVRGIRDYFKSNQNLKHIYIIGPDALGAKLEGSKDFSKQFMNKHGIPTAKSYTVTLQNLNEGISYIKLMNTPVVLKADGLAAGKGVLICETHIEAERELAEMIETKKFGEASSTVVIEEFLKGIELSVFVLTDGDSYIILPEAKDYKRIGEGDTGLNTGGMGAVSPVPFANKEFMNRVEEMVVKPTMQGIRESGMDYKGFVFIGLMNVNGHPYVIEYNVRMGDPETEVVLPRIKTDLGKLFEAVATEKLSSIALEIYPEYCTTVMLVAAGYPGDYEKGKPITGIEEVNNAMIFHAGSKNIDEIPCTNGGRVLAVSAMSAEMGKALEYSLAAAELIQYEGKYYRKDIGKDLMP